MDTERLYLREIKLSDLDDLYEIYSGKGITDYMEGLYPDRRQEEEFTRKYIEHMYKFYEYGMWIICLKENDKIIGRAGIENREVDGENKIELGYVIGVPYQRQGYGFEVCNAICEFAKRKIEADEIICFMENENKPSKMLAEKLGFICVGESYSEEDNKKYLYYVKKL